MASALACQWVDRFCVARDTLNEIEFELGRLSALLVDVADTMVDEAGSLSSCVDDLSEWPTADRLRSLADGWKLQRSRMQAAWDRLSERERRQVGRMPRFGGADPTRAVL